MGMFQSNVIMNNTLAVSNVIVERNYAPLIDVRGSGGSVSNFVIRDNITGMVRSDVNVTGLLITNNIFNDDASFTTYHTNILGPGTGLTIKNNLFTKPGIGFLAMAGFTNSTIENNIFFSREPVTSNADVQTSTFNNNLTYNVSWTTLPFGTNVGSGNINSDPQFYISPVGFDFSMTTNNSSPGAYNWRLQPSSPAKNAGTDGTDIGPTGGASPMYVYPAPYPLTGEPAVPQVQSVALPVSSVPSGGTLNIQVKARKRN
jgi:hypothetical protein